MSHVILLRPRKAGAAPASVRSASGRVQRPRRRSATSSRQVDGPRCWDGRKHQRSIPPLRTAPWRAKHLVRRSSSHFGARSMARHPSRARERRSSASALGAHHSAAKTHGCRSSHDKSSFSHPSARVSGFGTPRTARLSRPRRSISREHGGESTHPRRKFHYIGTLTGTFSVAAQLPCEAVAARLRPGAEAPRPNSTGAASRRLQFGCSLIAAAGVPLVAQPRGTGRAAYMGR